MSADPREREDGLGWVTRALFPGDGSRVTVQRHATPGAPAWAIVPSVERARFLVPLGNRRVAAASMLAYNGLRSGPTRAVRSVLGSFARTGALPFPVLSATGSLVDHLASVLEEPHLFAAVGIRPPDPNRKPTLQLFGPDGRPRGYAKVGWNEATRGLVRAESAALRGLPRNAGPGYPVTPRPLHAGEWAGQEIGVTAPLPERVRRLSDPDEPRPAAMLAVARRGGPPGERVPLAESPFLHRLRQETAQVAGPEGTAIRAAVEALATRAAGVAVELGDWHGDWVPWNLGEVPTATGSALVAWDWEHSGPGVPVGFDLAHQAFNTALVVGGRRAGEAAEAAVAAVRRHGPALGLEPAAAGPVVDAYLIEMWLRTWRLAAGGAGWNPDLHPALLEVLEFRNT
ncbi:hypothetical protein [Symbioplanes lichenis]|uniref:hypothetical protein n=1 Tax=Symbioplanes lichenis TaxID=1629072 RepID=UPI002738540C|nr:hypothetical protein [Actinoplanes lichenis]